MKLSPLPLLVLALLTAAIGLPSAHAQATKIASANMAKVFSSYWKTQEADQKLKLQRDVYKSYVTDKEAQIKAMLAQFESLRQPSEDDPIRSEEDRLARINELKLLKAEIEREQAGLQAYVKEKMGSLQEIQVKQRKELVAEIDLVVKRIAEAEKFDLILDSSGLTYNRIPMLTFAKPEMDLTDRLIASINEGHPDAQIIDPNNMPPAAPAPAN